MTDGKEEAKVFSWNEEMEKGKEFVSVFFFLE